MTRPELTKLVDEAGEDELEDILGDLERAKARAMRRLLTPKPAAPHASNVSVQEAARRLAVSPDWIYERPDLPFVVKLGGRTVCNEQALDKYIRSRQGRG